MHVEDTGVMIGDVEVMAMAEDVASSTIQVQSVAEELDMYVKAIQSASGLTVEQAKTCVYYAVATYHIDSFDLFPILLFQGNMGTGKSGALEQISMMAWNPKSIGGDTMATVRDGIDHDGTVLIDEADYIRGLERLLTLRYSRRNSERVVNKRGDGGWYKKKLNIFGATVICRRSPFRDVALQSRTIVIATRSRPAEYHIVEVSNLGEIAIGIEIKLMATFDRVSDVWEPLRAVARAVDDNEWLEYAEQQIQAIQQAQKLAAGIEPNDAVVYAIKIHYSMGETRANLSDLKQTLREQFDVPMNIPQIMAICQQKGIKVVRPQDYPQVVIDSEKIDQLIADIEGTAEQ